MGAKPISYTQEYELLWKNISNYILKYKIYDKYTPIKYI